MQTKLDILINAKGEYQALDESRKRVFALRAEIGALSSAIQAGAGLSIGAGIVQGLAAVPAAVKSALAAGVAYNANIEKQTASFKALLGSMGEAGGRMRDLSNIAATTPFELPQLVQASRTLQTFGGNVLAAGDGLRLIGDAASAVGAPLGEVAMWSGRLFAALRQGTSTGEAVQNLTQLGLVSGELRAKLLALQGQALSEAAAMDVLKGAFGRYAGAMDDQSKTFEGLTSTMVDNFNMLRAELTRPLFDDLKKELRGVIEVLGSEGFGDGLKTTVRMLSDLVVVGIRGAEMLMRFSDVLVLLGAAWAAVKIGQHVQSLTAYVTSLGSAQAAEAKLVAAVEAEIAVLTGKQAALTRLIELQQRLNSLQALGNINSGLASAWAPGVRTAAASEALAQTRAMEGLNTAMKAAPGLVGQVAAAGRGLFAALGGWGTVAVAGVFAIEWWKNWRLEAIDALDQVREAAAGRLRGLRDEVAKITTELQRMVMITKLEALLAAAQANPSKHSPEEIENLKRLLAFTKKVDAETLARRAAPKTGSTDPIDQIDTLLRKQEDTLERRNRLQREYNGLTAEEVLTRRRASEATMAQLKQQLEAIRSQLAPLEAQRSQLKAFTDQPAPELPKGTVEDAPVGFISQNRKILRTSPQSFTVISDEQAAAYEAAQRFAAMQAAAQAKVNESQADYNRLLKESEAIEKQLSDVSASMPKAEALADYIEASKAANKAEADKAADTAKQTAEEAAKIAELRLQRSLLGADDARRLAVLNDEIAAGSRRVQTLSDGLVKEQALTELEGKRVEVQELLARQAQTDLDTSVRIAQIKQGAAQREREAIESRRIDGRLGTADQQTLNEIIGRQREAIEELIAAYKRLAAAKGTSQVDKAAAEDTIKALRQESDDLGKGSPAPRSMASQSAERYGSSGLAENSFQGANESITAGLQDAAVQTGTLWNNVHGSILNVSQAMRSSIGGSIRGLLTQSMSLGSALKNIGTGFADSMFQSFTDTLAAYATRRLMMAALGRTFDAGEIAANAAKQGTMLATDVTADATRTTLTAANAAARGAVRTAEAAHDVSMTGVQTGAHIAGEGTKTGATLMGSIGRGLLRVGETIFHGIQVGFRVAAHLAGEVLMTGITLAQFVLRLPIIIAESLAHVFKAGAQALGAFPIPFVGPILGMAAMAGVIAAGVGVVKSIGSRATGGPITAGSPYLVGEYGPELIIPSESAVVMNHKETAAVAERLGAKRGESDRRTGDGPRSTILVDNRREAERIRRGSRAEAQIVEITRRNRYRLFQ